MPEVWPASVNAFAIRDSYNEEPQRNVIETSRAVAASDRETRVDIEPHRKRRRGNLDPSGIDLVAQHDVPEHQGPPVHGPCRRYSLAKIAVPAKVLDRGQRASIENGHHDVPPSL